MNSQKEFLKWFDCFIQEKNIPFTQWSMKDKEGTLHLIDNEYIIETIKNAPFSEQKQIKKVIVYIDFKNGSINHFLKHLAGAIINGEPSLRKE